MAGGVEGRLSGKIAIVTGGSRGIGRASAELIAEAGALVIVGVLSVQRELVSRRRG
jgi:NAD(P)-dependent dehydrogenase (short-subunit alcohol dehydrogenase family)